MNETKTYIIPEWEWKTRPEDVEESSLDNLNKAFENYAKSVSSSKKVIGDFESRNIFVKDKLLKNNGNNVGVIEFNGHRVEFRPKLDLEDKEYFWKFLPKMLGTLSDFEDFEKKIYLDPNNTIKLPKGCSIVPLLALSFVSLLDKVIEQGLLKKYIQKEERLKKLKGKINFARLAQKRAWERASLPCVYNDLTFDNPENQIVFWCSQKLLNETRKIKGSKGKDLFILKKLREQYLLLSTEISLTPKTAADLYKLNISSIASNYVDLMNVCKAILEESLFSFTKDPSKTNLGVNFIINMDWVFEQYMTYLFSEVAEELNEAGENFEMVSQKKRDLCDKKRIKIKPDLVIKKNDQPVSIIDFKWKLDERNVNADFYQVISYGLASLQEKTELKEIETNLLAVSKGDKLDKKEVDTIAQIFEPEKKRIYINKISLGSAMLNNEDPNQIEKNIKDEIRKYLINLKTNQQDSD